MMSLCHFKTASSSLVFSLGGQMDVVLKEQFNKITFKKLSSDDERVV